MIINGEWDIISKNAIVTVGRYYLIFLEGKKIHKRNWS
jgi:hypothetical protein